MRERELLGLKASNGTYQVMVVTVRTSTCIRAVIYLRNRYKFWYRIISWYVP
jgi:hypothetical protein